MRLRLLIGVGLVGIGVLCGGYLLGMVLSTYLPGTLLVRIPVFLLGLGCGIYLVIQNRGYASDVLLGKYLLQKR